jgi:hypothetical protein
MHTAAATLSTASRKTTSWTGRGLSAFAVLFMIFDGVIHVAKPQPVVDAFAQLGFPLSTSLGLGVLELACVALYVIPRTSTLGAVLLTAFLGGATAAQVRVEAGWFPVIFPAMIGTLLWAGLAWRDARALGVFTFRAA